MSDNDGAHDLKLNNGQVAKYLQHDFWSRPVYEIEHEGNKYVVCCVELDGTHLHYYCPRNDMDGDPDYPLPNAFQPNVELINPNCEPDPKDGGSGADN